MSLRISEMLILTRRNRVTDICNTYPFWLLNVKTACHTQGKRHLEGIEGTGPAEGTLTLDCSDFVVMIIIVNRCNYGVNILTGTLTGTYQA